MARITVEDCIDKFPSRFELVLVASQRARKLHSGDNPLIEKDNDKNTVIALREIAEEVISVPDMKENLIQEYQTVTISDEEEENLELENSHNDKVIDNINSTSSEAESEMNELIKSEDSEIQEQYEITDNIDEVLSSDNDENTEDIQASDKDENQAESNL